MKRLLFRTASLSVLFMLGTGVFSWVSAQPGRGQFRGEGRMQAQAAARQNIKLNDDQQKQMNELRSQFQEETRKINNLINEKQAHLKTLTETDNRDMKDLDKTVADLTGLKADQIKKGIAHRDAVKKILTPEQMKIWDIQAHRRMDASGQGFGQRGMRGHMMRGHMMRDGNRLMGRGNRFMGGR